MRSVRNRTRAPGVLAWEPASGSGVSTAMRSHPRPVCDHPALKGRNGICPDCRSSVWFHEPRPFTPTELAVQRAVEVMSRWASAGVLPR
jgi:hypothetical protein